LQRFNFAAGPGAVPREILEQARDEMLDWHGTGMSVLEMPFTGPAFGKILAAAGNDLRHLLGIPPSHRILFLQGGAYAHFALVPMNLLRGRGTADYVETGHWSRRAITEARRYCQVNVAASSAMSGFDRVPPLTQWHLDTEAAYCHITTNETAEGVQFHWTPDSGETPLVADMTSDFLSRPVDVAQYGLIYASAQKNVGPAGLTVVIVREDLLGHPLANTPTVFDYGGQADSDSKVNTPPTYSIYVAGLVFQWLRRQGGLVEMARRARSRSARVYAAIDGSGGFYRCSIEHPDRSIVNVCFHLADETLERTFLEQADSQGLLNLKGHPVHGGLRASLYNAMTEEGVDGLVAFMEEFRRRWG
jgi:phosphoserine aminotransferase